MKYPKIESLYLRDEKTFKVLEGTLRKAEPALVKDGWIVTEKVDGTNIRVVVQPGGVAGGPIAAADIIPTLVEFRGRTDYAQLPPQLLKTLQEMLPPEKFDDMFEDVDTVILYGEGYGSKIQKGGGDYREGQSFRLFDVLVCGAENNWWLDWHNVEDVARKLGIKTVPVLAYGGKTLKELTFLARVGFASEVARVECLGEDASWRKAEGIVARTNPLLFDRKGSRVMWKLKEEDFERNTN